MTYHQMKPGWETIQWFCKEFSLFVFVPHVVNNILRDLENFGNPVLLLLLQALSKKYLTHLMHDLTIKRGLFYVQKLADWMGAPSTDPFTERE